MIIIVDDNLLYTTFHLDTQIKVEIIIEIVFICSNKNNYNNDN